MAKGDGSEKNGKNATGGKTNPPAIEYAFSELTVAKAYVFPIRSGYVCRFDSIGCAIAIDTDGLNGKSGRYRLGVVKFYLPKWEQVFVHLFSPEEGATEFATLPKALKYVRSCNMNDDEIEVDFSRLCKDRFWVGPSDLPKLQWLSDKPVWSRPDHSVGSPKSSTNLPDWKQCTECKYLIDDDETFLECDRCSHPYHSDCLLRHEKFPPPSFDRTLLETQATKYSMASKKWKARKTSRNPSLVIEDDVPKSDNGTNPSTSNFTETPPSKFSCTNCRDCRYCSLPLSQEIIPSISNPPSIQPFVVCIKCNSAFHGHCGFPQVPRLHASVEWQCDDCRECNSCGRITYLNESTGQPSLLTEWALPSFDQCKQCFAGLDKGEYCPVCMKAWTIEWGGDMVQCDLCEFWVHTLCDDLKSVSVSKLGKNDVKYNCPICRDTTDIHRRRRVIDLLRTIDKIALFSEPVSAAFLPVYLKVIKQPMDLSKMRAKNESESGYSSNIDFIADFELIVSNAKIFNMPNSPAFRLAEQFHKQGKMLIEKYLLSDKRGASKIEGLEEEPKDAEEDSGDVKMEEADDNGRRSRQASIQAAKSWSKPTSGSAVGGTRKPKSLTYNDVLEIIKKRGIEIQSTRPPPPVLEETDLGSSGSVISPYRKRRLSGGQIFGSPMPTTKPSSGTVTPIESHSVTTMLSESEILSSLISIFGLKDSWYVLNKFQVMDVNRVVKGAFVPLPDPVIETTQTTLTSVNETLKKFRWSLFESCRVCHGYGEPWNMIFCSDCGESTHYYCAGLVIKPNVDGTINPITGRTAKPYKCSSCYPGETGSRCGLCGDNTRRKIGEFQDEIPRESAPRFKLEIWENFSIEICSDCVNDQILRVIKSGSCAECSGTIHPSMATALMKILNQIEINDTSNSRSAPPMVHCVGCGKLWHARCLKEFSDLTNADVLGSYLCESCEASSAQAISDTVQATLSSCGNFLTQFKSSLYRDILIETAVDIFFQLGLCSNAGNKSSVIAAIGPSMNDLLDIFLTASGAPVSVSATALLNACKSEDRPKLEARDREWIEWGLVHKDFLTALSGLSTVDLSNKRKILESTLSDKNSVKYKRLDDEDLLFAKRIDKVGSILCELENAINIRGGEPIVKSGDMRNQLPVISADFGSNLTYDHLMSSGEKGAVLCQAWLKKYGLNGGYFGPNSTIGPDSGTNEIDSFYPLKIRRMVPDWETRTCALCAQKGDQIVMGSLLYFWAGNSGGEKSWIHSECLRWSLARDMGIANNWVEPIHAIPTQVSDSLGENFSTTMPMIIPNQEVVSIVEKAVSEEGGVFCVVCDQIGASVYCQQCSTSAYHFACALSVNELVRAGGSIASGFTPMSNRVVMDSRCSLLTCGKCLYRNNHLDKWFESEFASHNLKANQSIFGQVMSMVRRLRPLVVDIGDICRESTDSSRCGAVTILKRGTFSDDFSYDGRRNLVPLGFESIRIFSSIDVPITDELASKFGLSRDDKQILKYQHRCAYWCKISNGGKLYTIEIVGGRVVGIGTTLDECFNSFKELFEINRIATLSQKFSGEWFFGLTSECIRDYLNEVASKSVKKQASLRREKWMYHPQLRPAVVSALGLDSDLKPVSSFRRNLTSVASESSAAIDQLRSLGREKFFGSHKTMHDSDSPDHELLDPNMVIVEWVGAEDTKPSRGGNQSILGSSGSVGQSTGGFATKYKVRISIADSELLNVQRSKIHNYGLFSRNGFTKGEFVVEYQGEILRETIADEREKRAERAGNGDGGSCYMFRLDEDHVIDATVKGNCARFINHSCNPNCTCRMVEDENRKKHIMIIAKRDIAPGEEITYDYQFAVESEKLACLCGAPNCLGRLN